jgi:transcription elongation factor GreA
MTPDKFRELKEKLERLKKVVRPRLAAEVKRLALMGDFSENAAYQIAKGKLRGINQGILDTEDLLKRAVIIDGSQGNGVVRLGSRVTLESGGKQKKYLILGSTEADPTRGVISHISPLGAALIGKKPGNTVRLKIAEKIKEYKIINIE